MIDKAIEFLKNEVNRYIEIKTGNADKLVITNIVDSDGGVIIPSDSLGMTLVNIEEERVGKAQHPFSNAADGSTKKQNPEIKLNLYLLIAANPNINTGSAINNYDQGLQLISYVMKFFQGKSYFNNQNSPALDTGLKKLLVELYTLPIEQQNYLWAAVGAKYLPSVVYRVRLVSILDDVLQGSGPAIKALDVSIDNK